MTGIAGEIPGSQFVSIDSSNHILLEDEPGWQEFKKVFAHHVPGAAARPAAARDARERIAQLSKREQKILGEIAKGLNNREIADGPVHQREDRAQSHHQRLRQAGRVVACAGDCDGEGSGAVGRRQAWDICPDGPRRRLGPRPHERGSAGDYRALP